MNLKEVLGDAYKEGMTFEEVVSTVDAFIEEMDTFCVLETLETLRNNGRLSNLKAFVARALIIKPVLDAMWQWGEGDTASLK